MKKLILLSVICVFCSVSLVWSRRSIAMPIQAQFCGNRLVPAWQKKRLIREMLREGCNQADMKFIPVDDGEYVLGYAVKIVLAY